MAEPLWLADEGRPVEVNQRALIPKVLARYPSEFTLFRELLQNSDDAQASTVEIHFLTAAPRLASTKLPMLTELKSSDVVQWTFKNNGEPFREEGWRRLARIAEGNPDPAKVGAFGVGFYSLFSVTDCPLVSSGGYRMQFYWKDNMDQLFVRQGKLLRDVSSSWTIFDITLREPGHMPPYIDFMRFLATSITFMANLNDVRVFFNEQRIGHIAKFLRSTHPVDLLDEMKLASPQKIFTVDGIWCHRFTILAETSIIAQEQSSVPESNESCDLYPEIWSLHPLETTPYTVLKMDPMGIHTAELALTVFVAEVDVRVDKKLTAALFRCTAKKPPSRVRYSLVYTGKDDYDQSFRTQETPTLRSIFQGLRADLDGALHPRIFIGHSTSQTTGIGGHMESHFIPTVERESIDLVNRSIGIWNSELLYIGGFLSRAIYESELSAIQNLWKEATISSDASDSRLTLDSRSRSLEHFIHVLKFFTFYHSTPSPKVTQMLQCSFYECSTSSLRLLSSVGVHYASDIRMFDPLCDKFLKHVPMLSPGIKDVKDGIISALRDKCIIKNITLQDVLQELRRRTLGEEELIACLQWQINHGAKTGVKELLQAARFRGAGGTSIQLSSIQCFISPDGLGDHIPLDGPLPPHLIPRRITKSLAPRSLASFGWKEFTIIDWLRHISSPEVRSANPRYDFVRSSEWAERVLHSVSLAWVSSDEIRHLAKSTFGKEKCIPVLGDLRLPESSYLPSQDTPALADLHLPIVLFPSGRIIGGEMEQLLIDIGVQEHLPLQLLMQMVETEKWKTSNLVDYLVQVAGTLNASDMSELQSSNAFCREGAQRERFRADQLYPPLGIFRRLCLPLIEWRDRSEWQETSSSAKLLYSLGLRRYPPLREIIDLCTSMETEVRTNAFEYLCDNLRSIYTDYNPADFQHVAFVPAEDVSGPRLEKLGNVFLDNQWKIFKLSVIQHKRLENVIKELGVERHPPSSLLVQLLESEPPSSNEMAHCWFEILSQHITNFTPDQLDNLSRLPMVPKTISGQQEYLTPAQCYLEKRVKDDFYSKLFHFVDFGHKANHFLEACGAKGGPSEKDIAESLLDDPGKFLEVAKSPERYLKEVRELAVRSARIPNDTLSRMKCKPVLLGSMGHEETKNPDRIPTLAKPSEIVIVDDVAAYQLFVDSLIIAPRDVGPELEKFYSLLGCRYLSTVVRDHCDGFNEVPDTTTYSEFQLSDLVQKVPIFLHHYPHPHVKMSWPSSADGISIKLWERLSVFTTLTVGSKEITKKRDVWATVTAKYDQGKIQLWLSRNAKKDMYEIAVSLCRVLFGKVALSDALLLESILSQDLDVLKRRGYVVDQVLKRQQWIDDSGLAKTKGSSGSVAPGKSSLNTQGQNPMSSGSETACARVAADHSRSLEGGETTPGSAVPSSRAPRTAINFAYGVSQTIRAKTRDITSKVKARGTPTPSCPSGQAVPHVMRWGYIESNVTKAIEACNTRERVTVDYHGQMDATKFLKKGYCNVPEPVCNLRPLGNVENVKVFAGQGVPGADTFTTRMRVPLSLFVGTITPIAKIYNIPLESIHIFYNLTAGCIAFNDNGTVYLNFRYFEEWHYQDVQSGNSQQALSLWFFALAHEIAHNLVESHDSEHEFWFLAICDAHIKAFSELLVGLTPRKLEAGGGHADDGSSSARPT